MPTFGQTSLIKSVLVKTGLYPGTTREQKWGPLLLGGEDKPLIWRVSRAAAPSCHWGEWQGPTPLWATDGSSLGNLTLTNEFHEDSDVSERSGPDSKWAIHPGKIHACLLACENSSLYAFVDGQRNDEGSFCAGVVLVEPTHTPQQQLSCNTVELAGDHSRCYQQAERLRPNDSQLGTGQPAFHRRLLNECDLKATAISLLGCRSGYAATTPPLPATLAASPQSPFIYDSKPPLEGPLNPTWLGANPEGGANPGGPLSWVWPLPKFPSTPLPHLPAPPRKSTATLVESTGGQGGGAPGGLLKWASSWCHLSLCLLLGFVGIALLYRHLSRRAAHLRLSRDRAQSDLPLLAHQVSRLQTGTGDAHCSLGGALSDEWSTCLALTPPVSPPPGPPTSSSDESVLEQDQAASPARAEANRREPGERAGGSSSEQKAAVPLSWAEADRQFYAEQAARKHVTGMQRTIPARRAARAKQKAAVVPLSWAEADRQFYAEQAAKAQMEKKLPAGELPLSQTAPLAAAALAAEALAALSANAAGPSTTTTGPPQGASPGVAPSPTRTSSTLPSTSTSSTKRARQDR